MKSIQYIFLLIMYCTQISAMDFTVEQRFNTMSERQRIAQLLVAAVVPNVEVNRALSKTQAYRMDPEYVKEIAVSKHQIGGILYLGSGLIQERKDLTQELQRRANGTLASFDDAEWGTQMRSSNGYKYPWNQALGALEDKYNHLIKQKGFNIAKQLQALDSQVNLGPVADVNNNPGNPVINIRSFGSDADRVTKKVVADVNGLQDGGVAAVVKHFPGHGNTAVDSHYGLPLIEGSIEDLNNTELKPFIAAIKAGAMGVMTAHIVVPALDASGVPATVSRKILTDLLRNALGFKGIIVTDGMGMDGITNLYESSEAAVKALAAGADVILGANVANGKYNHNWEDPIGKTIDAIEQALKDGRLDKDEFHEKVMRILRMKEWAKNQRAQEIMCEYEILHQANAIKQEIYTHAITIAQNKLSHPSNAHKIIAIRGMNKFKAQQFGISNEMLEQIRKNHEDGKTQTVILYGSAYAVELIKDYADCIIVAYEDDPVAQHVVEDILSNKIEAHGVMPV